MATFSRVTVSCLFLHGIAGIDQRSLHQIYQIKLWGMYVHPQTWTMQSTDPFTSTQIYEKVGFQTPRHSVSKIQSCVCSSRQKRLGHGIMVTV